MQTPISKLTGDIVWTASPDDHHHLLAHVRLLNTDFHLDAIRVKESDDEQQSANEECPMLDDLGAFAAGDGPFETTEIDGKFYVLYMTPFCQ